MSAPVQEAGQAAKPRAWKAKFAAANRGTRQETEDVAADHEEAGNNLLRISAHVYGGGRLEKAFHLQATDPVSTLYDAIADELHVQKRIPPLFYIEIPAGGILHWDKVVGDYVDDGFLCNGIELAVVQSPGDVEIAFQGPHDLGAYYDDDGKLVWWFKELAPAGPECSRAESQEAQSYSRADCFVDEANAAQSEVLACMPQDAAGSQALSYSRGDCIADEADAAQSEVLACMPQDAAGSQARTYSKADCFVDEADAAQSEVLACMPQDAAGSQALSCSGADCIADEADAAQSEVLACMPQDATGSQARTYSRADCIADEADAARSEVLACMPQDVAGSQALSYSRGDCIADEADAAQSEVPACMPQDAAGPQALSRSGAGCSVDEAEAAQALVIASFSIDLCQKWWATKDKCAESTGSSASSSNTKARRLSWRSLLDERNKATQRSDTHSESCSTLSTRALQDQCGRVCSEETLSESSTKSLEALKLQMQDMAELRQQDLASCLPPGYGLDWLSGRGQQPLRSRPLESLELRSFRRLGHEDHEFINDCGGPEETLLLRTNWWGQEYLPVPEDWGTGGMQIFEGSVQAAWVWEGALYVAKDGRVATTWWGEPWDGSLSAGGAILQGAVKAAWIADGILYVVKDGLVAQAPAGDGDSWDGEFEDWGDILKGEVQAAWVFEDYLFVVKDGLIAFTEFGKEWNNLFLDPGKRFQQAKHHRKTAFMHRNFLYEVRAV